MVWVQYSGLRGRCFGDCWPLTLLSRNVPGEALRPTAGPEPRCQSETAIRLPGP